MDKDLLIIGAALVGAYLIFNRRPAITTATPAATGAQWTPQSPNWGYPPNIMNTSPVANNGQSWDNSNTNALISGLAGLGSSIAGAVAASYK